MGDEGEPRCQQLEPSTKRIIVLIYLYARKNEAIVQLLFNREWELERGRCYRKMEGRNRKVTQVSLVLPYI